MCDHSIIQLGYEYFGIVPTPYDQTFLEFSKLLETPRDFSRFLQTSIDFQTFLYFSIHLWIFITALNFSKLLQTSLDFTGLHKTISCKIRHQYLLQRFFWQDGAFSGVLWHYSALLCYRFCSPCREPEKTGMFSVLQEISKLSMVSENYLVLCLHQTIELETNSKTN